MENGFELILTIVNEGFSEAVMDAARSKGATGGTLISGRGTAKEEILAKFKVLMTPEKEIVLILSPKENTKNILLAINEHCGLMTDAHGIAFALPVDEVCGIKKSINIDDNKSEDNGETKKN